MLDNRIRQDACSVAFNEQGLSAVIHKGLKTKELTLGWVKVQKATAYKRDLFTVDRICLFFGRTDGTGIEVNEDMGGWQDLLEALPRFLPGCLPASEWLPVVTMPPFAENETVIYMNRTDEL